MDMDLLCVESMETMTGESVAYPDQVLLDDDRMLQNLLNSEDRYIPSSSYFDTVQRDITPDMRKIVADWMLEVTEEQKCAEEVFPLSMNYMDRFLSICTIRKSQLQLLGTTCLLLASKLKETNPMSARHLVYYTDNSVTIDDLWDWERLVVSKLKWDLSAVTPGDFVMYILTRLPIDKSVWDLRMIRRHAQTFTSLSAREYIFSVYTPSIVGAASVAAALHGLDWTNKTGYGLSWLINRLSMITHIEGDYIQDCLRQIEDMISDACLNISSASNETSGSSQGHQQQQQQQQQHQRGSGSGDQEMTSQYKLMEYEKASTPTDVRDVLF